MIERLTAALTAVTEAMNAYGEATDQTGTAAAESTAAQDAAIEATAALEAARSTEAECLDALRQRVDELDELLAPAPAKAKTAIARR